MIFIKTKCCLNTELAEEGKNVTLEMTFIKCMYDQLLKNVYLIVMVKELFSPIVIVSWGG